MEAGISQPPLQAQNTLILCYTQFLPNWELHGCPSSHASAGSPKGLILCTSFGASFYVQAPRGPNKCINVAQISSAL